MARKPKHPSAKSIRAGQTIYQVGVLSDTPPPGTKVSVWPVIVGGKRTPEPDAGCYISVASEVFLRDVVRRMDPWMVRYTFYSKRQANTFCKQLQACFNANKRRIYRD